MNDNETDIRKDITNKSKQLLDYIGHENPSLAEMVKAADTLWGKSPVVKSDKLDEIFSLQDKLNKRVGVDLDGLSDEDKAKWVLNYTRALQQELAELIDSVPWKWWAKYQKMDEQNARVEVVDCFHFLISLAQSLGMTADDVFQAYLKKNKVNLERQDSGYVKKDEDDCKHI